MRATVTMVTVTRVLVRPFHAPHRFHRPSPGRCQSLDPSLGRCRVRSYWLNGAAYCCIPQSTSRSEIWF